MNTVKAKPWAVLALISLAINLFLGGLMVGGFLRSRGPMRPMGPIALLGPTEDFQPGVRKIVDRVRAEHGDKIRAAMGRAAKSRAAAIDALCAERFDEAKVREEFRAFRSEVVSAQQEMHVSLIEAAKAMTPEQRRDLKEALSRGPRRGFHRHRRGRMGPFGAGPPMR